MEVNRVEQHRINKNKKNNEDDKIFKTIDNLCWKSKNLYNYGNYIIRQKFIETSKQKEQGIIETAYWIRYTELYQLCKNSEPYKEIGSAPGQATLKKLDKNWASFFATIKDYSKNPEKYLGRPRIPQYLHKENGRYELGINNQSFKIVDGYIFFSWTPLKILNNIFKTKIPNDSKLMQVRFVPKGNEYIMEVIYEIEVPGIENLESNRIAAIDLGVDNLMTITTNCGVNPIIINGKPLKSINQYYNKKISEMRSALKLRNDSDWSNEMQRFTTKRNNQVDDYIQKSTKMVVDFCKSNDIDTLVCGYNSGWKQETDMGKRVNQKFVFIPYLSIVQRLEYKCENEGIKFIKTNESYTSGTSFLDGEEPIEKNYNKDRRIYRGLFQSEKGGYINADVNGSYQIMKKAFPKAFANGIVNAGSHPVVVNIPLQTANIM